MKQISSEELFGRLKIALSKAITLNPLKDKDGAGMQGSTMRLPPSMWDIVDHLTYVYASEGGKRASRNTILQYGIYLMTDMTQQLLDEDDEVLRTFIVNTEIRSIKSIREQRNEDIHNIEVATSGFMHAIDADEKRRYLGIVDRYLNSSSERVRLKAERAIEEMMG